MYKLFVPCFALKVVPLDDDFDSLVPFFLWAAFLSDRNLIVLRGGHWPAVLVQYLSTFEKNKACRHSFGSDPEIVLTCKRCLVIDFLIRKNIQIDNFDVI